MSLWSSEEKSKLRDSFRLPNVVSVFRFFLHRSRTPSLWALPPGTGSPGERARVEGGDPDDLHQLVVEHGDAVFRLAYSVVRDRALAEDVTQDTMLKAWLALPTFRGDSSIRGWIMRIAHNTAISALRSRRAFVTDPIDMPEAPVDPARLPEHRAEEAQVRSDFERALDTLDDLSRSVVVLREIEGLPYDEIARLLGVPLPTVKTRLLRARRKLASALREWS